jgi:hypothetical protein
MIAAAHRWSALDESCWDDVAIRDLIAAVLYSLHRRDLTAVGKVALRDALWHLDSDQRITQLVEPEVAGVSDPAVIDRWSWLTRTWNPTAPAWIAAGRAADVEPRWGGLSRGIACGLPDPAIEICALWAAEAVAAALVAESHGLPRYQRVRVTGGPYEGEHGYVVGQSWLDDDDAQTVTGPHAYDVDLDNAEDTVCVQGRLLALDDTLRWPDRPAASRERHGSMPDAASTSRPAPVSCATDLQQLLERAANPETVPAALRARIAAAVDHSLVELEHQATAHPNRWTWQVILHRYQLTQAYADDQHAEVFELVVTRHLHDPHPAHYVALRETDVPDLLARCTRRDA